MKKVYSGIS